MGLVFAEVTLNGLGIVFTFSANASFAGGESLVVKKNSMTWATIADLTAESGDGTPSITITFGNLSPLLATDTVTASFADGDFIFSSDASPIPGVINFSVDPQSLPTMTQAIVSLYNATASTYNATSPAVLLPTQLWFDEVPEDQPQLPIAQFIHEGETPFGKGLGYSTTSTKPDSVEGKFSITLWFTSASLLDGTWIPLLMQTFIPNSLLITGSDVVTFRTSYELTATKLRDASNNPVYSATLRYRVLMSPPPN